MRSILVTNPKGGSGKTTVATNLAAACATQGRRSLLADLDRQRSSLNWLARRPRSAPRISGLDWSESADWRAAFAKAAKKRAEVLIIDAPAAIKLKRLAHCLEIADILVVPVLPSVFDQETTARFLDRLTALKPLRKNKTALALIRNRVRKRSRAAARLDLFLLDRGHRDLGWIGDRALYNEAAAQGLSIFDLAGKQAEELRADWQPLLHFIEAGAPGAARAAA